MARPRLTNESFLQYLFHPKRNPKPTGIRKTVLSGLQGGRTKGRLAAFNRMSAPNQEMLRRSGLRDAYLRGEVKLSEARRSLRQTAVDLGIARPLPARTVAPTRQQTVEALIARHIKDVLDANGKHYDSQMIDNNVGRIPGIVKPFVGQWDYQAIKDAASEGSPFERIENAIRFNPFWYGAKSR